MRQILKKALREPIVVFLLISSAFYMVYQNHQTRNNPDMIVVNQQKLEAFIQYRQRRFDGQSVSEKLAQMSAEEKEQLIEDYVFEEVMVREARALQLDANDYIIRQRLIQKLEFLDEEKAPEIEEADLRDWYKNNQATYKEPALISFEHVFFKINPDKSREEAEAQAHQRAIDYRDNKGKSDRFAYHNFYQKRDIELVQSHFGAAFAADLFARPAKPNQWQGPLKSRFGFHLVKIAYKQEQRKMTFEQARNFVLHDFRQEQKIKRRQKLAEQYLKNYQLVVE